MHARDCKEYIILQAYIISICCDLQVALSVAACWWMRTAARLYDMLTELQTACLQYETHDLAEWKARHSDN